MDKRCLEQTDEGDKVSHVSEVDIDGSAIPERIMLVRVCGIVMSDRLCIQSEGKANKHALL
ncbi:hypothetical protein OESDEN_20320 [Oesophagostomum dentatum]|uniref:Uncharacterized protein n=1 Tax=Oesophagostomum dentatum TaxID=61180 RepID=A0A0B1S9W1_OESDE|nr:hypothetical protein OESDEN_20320 [Oesophagostomum dentatum]